jgi:hypothetical protein
MSGGCSISDDNGQTSRKYIIEKTLEFIRNNQNISRLAFSASQKHAQKHAHVLISYAFESVASCGLTGFGSKKSKPI